MERESSIAVDRHGVGSGGGHVGAARGHRRHRVHRPRPRPLRPPRRRAARGVAASSPDERRGRRRELGAERAFDTRRGAGRSRTRSTSSTSAPRTTCICRWRAAALEAGKHVVCEKPVALDSAGAAELAAAAERAGRVATVPFVYRYYPTVREARARARAGALGDLQLLYGGYLQDWLLGPTDDNWRVEPELGGPSRAFADIGSHWCDLIEFVSGQRIASVSARTAVAHAERPRREARSFERGDGDGAPRRGRDRGHRHGDVRDRRRDRRLDRGLAGLGRAQEPALVRGLRHRGGGGLRPGAARDALGRAPRRGRAGPARLRHPERRGGRLRHPPRRPPAGLRGLLRRLRRRDLRGDPRRGRRRRAAGAGRRAARPADHRGRARVGARADVGGGGAA